MVKFIVSLLSLSSVHLFVCFPNSLKYSVNKKCEGLIKCHSHDRCYVFSFFVGYKDPQRTIAIPNIFFKYTNYLFNFSLHFYLFSDPPTIQNVSTSSKKSWIGQTVTLKCLSDGVPTPTLSWYKPEGSEINRVTARENKVQVPLRGDQDFGHYKCIAANGLVPSDEKLIKINQISKLKKLVYFDKRKTIYKVNI